MMKKIVIYSFLFCIGSGVFAQKYKSQKNEVSFFSEAPLENIEAVNTKSQSVLDIENKNIVFAIPSDAFVFEKELMQEHFNEKYLESDKYPKSIFSGKFSGFDTSKKGKQNVTATGKITIHGVERNISVDGVMEMLKNEIVLSCIFKVKLEDHKIAIPQLLWQNIAEEVEVKLSFEYIKIK